MKRRNKPGLRGSAISYFSTTSQRFERARARRFGQTRSRRGLVMAGHGRWLGECGSSGPELVIFYCDGVLVDSEPIANRVMAEAIAALGWPLTTADCIAWFKGHHLDTVIAVLEDWLGRPVP